MTVTIIAECGVSHNGSVDEALRMCDAAKESGANICKFQTYLPEIAIDKNSKDYDLLYNLALPFTDFLKIAKHCEDIGIEFCSTPDDLYSLKFLVDECGVKRIKIGSGSLTYTPLLEAAYSSRLPIILSTGMASILEIADALPDGCGVKRIKIGSGSLTYTPLLEAAYSSRLPIILSTGMASILEIADALPDGFLTGYQIPTPKITLLHCVSLYPCPIELANLKAITTIYERFKLPIGYSDHTLSVVAIPCAAVALGATVIEKHFTLNRYAEGPDHAMSLDPYQFSEMVREIRKVEKALGDGTKTIREQEAAMIPRIRKSEDGKQPGL